MNFQFEISLLMLDFYDSCRKNYCRLSENESNNIHWYKTSSLTINLAYWMANFEVKIPKYSNLRSNGLDSSTQPIKRGHKVFKVSFFCSKIKKEVCWYKTCFIISNLIPVITLVFSWAGLKLGYCFCLE